tara:strand:- start:211 stop:933 length:723 start_codon:yes stop_codon:yes gene_type:complete
MDNTSTFAIEFMSNDWIRNASITVLISSIYFYFIYNLEKNKITKALKISALVIFTMTIVYHVILILNNLWTLKEDLPLHLCSVSALICCLIFFVNKKQYLFEFVFYCGIIGGTMAVLTPQITLYDGNYFFYIMFYFKHASIIVIPLLLMYKLKMNLSRYSWLRVFAAINILLVIVTPVNAALGSNYLYVAEPPIAKNPLILGTGENTILGLPDYVFGFEIIILLLLFLFYLIFKSKNKNV